MPQGSLTAESLNRRQKALVPDYLDDPNPPNSDDKILPSFIDLKRKTLQSLYGLDKNRDYNHALLMDKSPKGSVDEKIRSMVDLINAHPSFATLSSCSGRISLFDPNTEATSSSQSQNNDDTTQSTEELAGKTGKGFGAWLISEHGQITPSQLISALEEQAKSNSCHPLTFKHEPLLLHVAASNLSRARQLLKMALDLGFRESGTVITPKRITVAIRSHSLTLTVPIASKGNLRPSDGYLEELVREANERFDLNEEKLKRLEDMIQSTIFTSEDEHIDDVDNQEKDLKSIEYSISKIPDLNLWGHTSFVVRSKETSSSDAMIIAHGGYGAGPNSNKKSPSRSNKVYALHRSEDQWDTRWAQLNQVEINDAPKEETFYGFRGRHCVLPAREGSESCVLPQSVHSDDEATIVAIFGGRSSPARPSNELFLMVFKLGNMHIFSPSNIKGEIPPPRWGHSFTALSGKAGKLAILIGGRDEKGAVPSVYILSCTLSAEGDSKSYQLVWEKIDHDIRRFYHCATRLNPNDDRILVQGGLVSTALVPAMAKEDGNGSNNPCFSLLITKESGCEIKELKDKIATTALFGASSCPLSAFNRCGRRYSYMLTSGGLSYEAIGKKPQAPLQAMACSVDDGILTVERILEIGIDALDQHISFGSMVHHSCLELPASGKGIAEVMLVGGGVPAFSFGQSYAR